MDEIPGALRRYLATVALGAVAVLGLTLAWETPNLGALTGPTAALVVVGMVLAGLRPVHVMARTKISADWAFLVAAALLADPAAAMVLAAVGVGTAQALRRRSRAEAIFNTAQAALCAGAGSAAARFLAGASIEAELPAPVAVASALAVVILMHGLSSLLVAVAGALQTGAAPLAFWQAGLWLDVPEQIGLGAAGVALAAWLANGSGLAFLAVTVVVPLALTIWMQSCLRGVTAHLPTRIMAGSVRAPSTRFASPLTRPRPLPFGQVAGRTFQRDAFPYL